MTMHVTREQLRGSSTLRGVRGIRADADPIGEIRALVTQIADAQKAQKTTFETFKTENDAKIEAKTKDVVQAEKVDRINAALDTQGKSIDELSAQLAALKIAGPGTNANGKPRTAAQVAHGKAFDGWFRKGQNEAALQDLAIKAELAVGSDPDGGFTVTPEIEQTIDRILPNVSAIRGLATVMQIGSPVYRKVINKAGTSSGWVGETEDRAETGTPQLSGMDFPVMEIYAEPAATQALLDDSFVNIADWLAGEVSIVFAEQEGLAFAAGDGNNKPKGIVAYGTVADSGFSASSNWGKLGYIPTGGAADFAAAAQADCLIDLEDALKTGYQPNARWLMNRKTRASIRKFKNSLGDYLWQPGLLLGTPDTLNGKPIVIDDNMPNVGAGTYPIAFGDFKRGYLIVDRVGIRMLRDPFSNKPFVLFYTTKRVGGGVQNFEAIKLLKVAAS